MPKADGTQTENEKITTADTAFAASFVAKQTATPAPAAVAAVADATPPVTKAVEPPIPAKAAAPPATAADAVHVANDSAADETDAPKTEAADSALEDLDDDDLDAANGEDETADELAPSKFDQKFVKAMKEQGIDFAIDQLPEAARPIVQRRIKELESGFTKLRQRDSERVQHSLTLQAEKVFTDENFTDIVAHRYTTDADFKAKVDNALEDLLSHPRAPEFAKGVWYENKSAAVERVKTEREDGEKRERRATQVENTMRAAATAAGIKPDKKGYEADIAKVIREHGDITRAEVFEIAKQHARELREIQRAATRDASKAAVNAAVTINKTAGLPLKPGTGQSPGPAAAVKPKNDAEFAADFERRMTAKANA